MFEGFDGKYAENPKCFLDLLDGKLPQTPKKIHNELPSLKLTSFSPLKMDGWNTFNISFWGVGAYLAYFQVRNCC